MVTIGMLGSGFVANFYMQGLKNVPGQQVVLNTARTMDKARNFAKKWGIPEPMDNLDKAIARDNIDVFIIALPNFLHEEAVHKLSEAGRAMVCTKPLGRSTREAQSMLEAVREAGVFNGYAENEVFSPAVTRARQMIAEGLLGRVTWIRSRQAHSGPHEDWFWNKNLSGGGALLDLGCHSIEVARCLFGKVDKIEEVMAWADTLVHKDRTSAEDNALLILRFASGGIAHVETSWSSSGGVDFRNEIYGTEGSVFTDVTRSTPIRAFTQQESGYVLEKAGVRKGWIFPVPEEAFAYGYQAEMKHFVECMRTGRKPIESFEDGYIVNVILDAAYQSIKEKTWIRVSY